MKKRILCLLMTLALSLGLSVPAFAATGSSASSFSDVASGDWFYDQVLWAVQNGITTGTTTTTFSPNATCTKAQIITFIWRASGEPAPSNVGIKYKNPAVSANQYYYNAMLWAFGTLYSDEGLDIDPNAPCKRSDVAMYLWNLGAKQSPSKPASERLTFNDVPANAAYADAVAWAVDADITEGMGDGRFCPEQTCTRAQIVTFLQRFFVDWKSNHLTISSQDELNALALRGDVGSIRKIIAVNAYIDDLTPLRNMTGLTHLDLFFNLSVGSLEPLRSLTRLTYLDLAADGVTDISPLAGMTGMIDLDLSGNGSLSDLTPLRGMTELEKLGLSSCSSVSDLTPLYGLKKLTSLDLRLTGATQEQIDALQAQLPNCQIMW